jgi:hypothetical protein
LEQGEVKRIKDALLAEECLRMPATRQRAGRPRHRRSAEEIAVAIWPSIAVREGRSGSQLAAVSMLDRV